MTKDSPLSAIPDTKALESRFAFIDNNATRESLAFCFQYIIFLTIIKSLHNSGGPLQSSMNRDIVVHTASVVETCLHYCVTRSVKLGIVDETKLGKVWSNAGQGQIIDINENEKIIWMKQSKAAKIYSSNPASKDVNQAAKDLEILDKNLFNKAEKIRTVRNNIHFMDESKNVEYPTDDEVNKYFDDARDILKRVEEKLVIK